MQAPKTIMKFRGVAFHLYHEQRSRENCPTNEQRYLESIREHRTRCRFGLDSHLPYTYTYPPIILPTGTQASVR